jgi:hypothetical protein
MAAPCHCKEDSSALWIQEFWSTPAIGPGYVHNPVQISVRAQSSPDGAGPEELIQRLQKRIDQLEASQKVMQEKIDHMGAAAPSAQPPEAAATLLPKPSRRSRRHR